MTTTEPSKTPEPKAAKVTAAPVASPTDDFPAATVNAWLAQGNRRTLPEAAAAEAITEWAAERGIKLDSVAKEAAR